MQGENEARLGLYRVPLLLLTHEICRLSIKEEEKRTTKNRTHTPQKKFKIKINNKRFNTNKQYLEKTTQKASS